MRTVAATRVNLPQGQATRQGRHELCVDDVNGTVAWTKALQVDVSRIARPLDHDVHQYTISLTVLLSAWIDVLLRTIEVADARALKDAAGSLPRVAVIPIPELGLDHPGARSEVEVERPRRWLTL
jgi:hypothetical protein